jgi:hypothetical protein
MILKEKIDKNKTIANYLNKNKDKEKNIIIKKEEITKNTEDKKEVSNLINKKDYLQVMLQIENKIII